MSINYVVYNSLEDRIYVACMGYFNYILENDNYYFGTLPYGLWPDSWIILGVL